jgi:hypothetical protein
MFVMQYGKLYVPIDPCVSNLSSRAIPIAQNQPPPSASSIVDFQGSVLLVAVPVTRPLKRSGVRSDFRLYMNLQNLSSISYLSMVFEEGRERHGASQRISPIFGHKNGYHRSRNSNMFESPALDITRIGAKEHQVLSPSTILDRLCLQK